jgi:hypothetical protein
MDEILESRIKELEEQIKVLNHWMYVLLDKHGYMSPTDQAEMNLARAFAAVCNRKE